jgi:hypothetical protein
MTKYLGLILLVFLMASCKTAQPILTEGKAKDTLSSAVIVDRHYQNAKLFSTLYIKSAVHYEDDKDSQNMTAEIKIKKDEKILISVRFLGITMAKALITPNKVSYYEKMNNTYFEGDFSTLSRWLGTPLDYNSLQNLFLGRAFEDLHQKMLNASIDDQKMYRLEDVSHPEITKIYSFESGHCRLKKQQFVQNQKQQSLQVVYPSEVAYGVMSLPTGIVVDALQPGGRMHMDIDFNHLTIDEELSFPYNVPEGYKLINIH